MAESRTPGQNSQLAKGTSREVLSSEEADKRFGASNIKDTAQRKPDNRMQDGLPTIWSKDITRIIDSGSTSVVTGESGCGKSTRVPQVILDCSLARNQRCNILVTQPNPLAAWAIADQVCKERKSQLGSLVGVAVENYEQVSKDTRLTYCTTGLLLRRLTCEKTVQQITHLILDEVHERNQDMDLLLLLVKRLQSKGTASFKVILMSATINATEFARYLRSLTKTGWIEAPIFRIPKNDKSNVQVQYLDQLDPIGGPPEMDNSNPRVSKEMMLFCVRIVAGFDGMDEETRHATLIFMPGISEIMEQRNLMIAQAKQSKWDIVVLHSGIPDAEQKRIFTPPSEGYRRVILSTNIAESSFTIDNVNYVIDYCMTRQQKTDPETNWQCSRLTWASKANCEQRSGRAGRTTMNGIVYRLVTRTFYEGLPSEADPEMVRAPLENVVLQTKLLGIGRTRKVLAEAMCPPDMTNLEGTILLLKQSGALMDKHGTHDPFDGILTDFGQIMAALQVDIRIAKMIALGHAFSVLHDAIVMGAAVYQDGLFCAPRGKRVEAYGAWIHWARGTSSDPIAFLRAYRAWKREMTAKGSGPNSAQEKSWARRNFIRIKNMHEVDHLVGELTKRLQRLGITEARQSDRVAFDEDVDRELHLKLVIAGAFLPNYYAVERSATLAEDKTRGSRFVGGFDTSRSVYLRGWPADQPAKLYSKSLQHIFKDVVPCEAVERTLVEFEDSTRVLVVFDDDRLYGSEPKQNHMPGRVSLAVYKALYQKKLRIPVNVQVLDERSARQRARELKIHAICSSALFNEENHENMRKILPSTLPKLPGLNVRVVELEMTHFDHPGKFWARECDEGVYSQLREIGEFLNDPNNDALRAVEDVPSIGALVAALWHEDNRMYRAVVESLREVKNEGMIANVLYIDFGNRDSVRLAHLKTIEPRDHKVATMQALAFECCLKGVQMSRTKDPRRWSNEARRVFYDTVNAARVVYGSIYSVVDSVVHLELTCQLGEYDDASSMCNLNQRLVQLELAEPCAESYPSEYNYKIRQSSANFDERCREYLEYLQYDKNYLTRTYPEPPPVNDCGGVVALQGPYSPLETCLTSLATAAAYWQSKVSIDFGSVNSILLDTDPDDPHQRLVVAAHVGKNKEDTQTRQLARELTNTLTLQVS